MYYRLAVVCLLFPWLAGADEQTLDRLFTDAQNQLLSGEYLRAREGFAKVWKKFEKAHGEFDPLTIEARIYYGQVLSMTGEAAAAMTVLGPVSIGDSRNAMIARGSFALALTQVGRFDRAAKMLTELVQQFPPDSPQNMVHLARMHSELALCLAYSKRFGEAEENARKALRLIEYSGLSYTIHRPSIYTILGQIYMWSGRDADAYATLTKALEEAKPFWRSDHPELGLLEELLGKLALRAGRYNEAESRTRNAMDSLLKLLGPDHSEVGLIANQLAAVLKKQKRKAEAKEYEACASRILKRTRVEPQVSAWSFREVR